MCRKVAISKAIMLLQFQHYKLNRNLFSLVDDYLLLLAICCFNLDLWSSTNGVLIFLQKS